MPALTTKPPANCRRVPIYRARAVRSLEERRPEELQNLGVYRFPAMPAGADHALRTAAVLPVCSLPGALRISMALSRQNRALAGRLRERYPASASSVISGLSLSASMVIWSLSGVPALVKGTETGPVVRFSAIVVVSCSIAMTWPVMGWIASLGPVSVVVVVVGVVTVSLETRCVTVRRLVGLIREPLLARARRKVAIGNWVCLASSASAESCCAFSCFSSAAVSEIVSAIIV